MQEIEVRTPDALFSKKALILRCMRAKSKLDKKPPTKLQLEVAPRLKAIKAELKMTGEQFAEFVGAGGGRTRWQNWIAPQNLPKEECMVTLCQKTGITLDWLYRGVYNGMDLALAIRLRARLEGIDPVTIRKDQMTLLGSELAQEAFPLSGQGLAKTDQRAKQTSEFPLT